MGAALLAGWSKTKIAAAFYVVEPAAPKRIAGVRYYATAAKLPQDLAPALVVLAVKPQALDAILPDYRRFAGRATFLSIAAGKTLAALARGSRRVFGKRWPREGPRHWRPDRLPLAGRQLSATRRDR